MKQSLSIESESQQTRHSAVSANSAVGIQAFADNRESTAAQRQLKVAMANSAQAAAQRKIGQLMNNNSHMLAQRRMLSGELVQRVEEEESLQKKSEPIQRVEEEELQKKAVTDSPAQLKEQSSTKPNNTGLPDNLKSGIEALSGLSMDSVRVHYNSSQPAQLNALAYAQGTDIHIAPGQEQHLPHETWHVVQQAQGRVQPTMQMKDGIPINDDEGLEHEADVMGGRALASGQILLTQKKSISKANSVTQARSGSKTTQLATEISYTQAQINYWRGGANYGPMTVGRIADAFLDPADPKTGSRTGAAPHPSVYTNGNWPTLYQGHLLNANLGGQAISSNLFPVTPSFNSQHSSIIEDNVKAELLDLNAKRANPFTAAAYANRRLHYRVEVMNPHLGGPFRPAHIGATTFRCLKEYTNNNVTPLGGTGADHTLNHGQIDIQVPAPPDVTLNERLSTLNWAPDNAPTYTLGPVAAPNVHTVLDGAGHAVPNMFIRV